MEWQKEVLDWSQMGTTATDFLLLQYSENNLMGEYICQGHRAFNVGLIFIDLW